MFEGHLYAVSFIPHQSAITICKTSNFEEVATLALVTLGP